MTSERIFCKCKDKFEFDGYCRTSDETKLESFSEPVKSCGFTEPTATIVWNVMCEKLEPTDFILWNVFPFHLYKTKRLSNRTPVKNELKAIECILKDFLKLVEGKQIIAVGNVAYDVLKGIKCSSLKEKVRHPSFGGKKEFQKQIQDIFK